MTFKELKTNLNATVFNVADANRDATCGYCGDFLSFVMGKAPTDCVWFTVMNNVNVCAVATLADVAVTVLCEGVQPDDALLAKAQAQGKNLIGTELDVYHAVKAVQNKLDD